MGNPESKARTSDNAINLDTKRKLSSFTNNSNFSNSYITQKDLFRRFSNYKKPTVKNNIVNFSKFDNSTGTTGITLNNFKKRKFNSNIFNNDIKKLQISNAI